MEGSSWLASLHFSFLICKMGINKPTSQSCCDAVRKPGETLSNVGPPLGAQRKRWMDGDNDLSSSWPLLTTVTGRMCCEKLRVPGISFSFQCHTTGNTADSRDLKRCGDFSPPTSKQFCGRCPLIPFCPDAVYTSQRHSPQAEGSVSKTAPATHFKRQVQGPGCLTCASD